MAFFCYHRDRLGSLELRNELREDHWSYMDRFTALMVARGPTLTGDGRTPTGSVHIVDLPDPATARSFAFEEPLFQAGVYREVVLRRWHNALGRTMWDFRSAGAENDRYLVMGFGADGAVDAEPQVPEDDLIAYGPLLSDDGSRWLGTALLVEAADPGSARSWAVAKLNTPA